MKLATDLETDQNFVTIFGHTKDGQTKQLQAVSGLLRSKEYSEEKKIVNPPLMLLELRFLSLISNGINIHL